MKLRTRWHIANKAITQLNSEMPEIAQMINLIVIKNDLDEYEIPLTALDDAFYTVKTSYSTSGGINADVFVNIDYKDIKIVRFITLQVSDQVYKDMDRFANKFCDIYGDFIREKLNKQSLA